MKKRRKKMAKKRLLKTQPKITNFFLRDEDENDSDNNNTNIKHTDDMPSHIYTISDFDTPVEEDEEGIHMDDLDIHISPEEINNEAHVVWDLSDFDTDVPLSRGNKNSVRKSRKKRDKEELDDDDE